MQLDPALAALRDELERLGFVAVPHSDHLCVRLPLLASVRVSVAGGALRLEPLFGPVRRSRALVVGALGAPAAVAAVFAVVGLAPVSLAALAGAAAYLLSDAYRLILTEGCVTRLQLLWTTRGATARPEPALGAGAAAAQLRAPSSDDSPAPAGRAASRRPA